MLPNTSIGQPKKKTFSFQRTYMLIFSTLLPSLPHFLWREEEKYVAEDRWQDVVLPLPPPTVSLHSKQLIQYESGLVR
jgi:hypothetical protein